MLARLRSGQPCGYVGTVANETYLELTKTIGTKCPYAVFPSCRGYGIASVEFDVPADGRTVYQLFSVSKIFAGIPAMKLVESGQLSLDAPVTDFFQELPAEWKTIRIRNLLTHTSGMQDRGALTCISAD